MSHTSFYQVILRFHACSSLGGCRQMFAWRPRSIDVAVITISLNTGAST